MGIFGMQPSKKFSLNWLDFGKGLIMAILVPVLLFLEKWADAGVMVWDWKGLVMAAIAGTTAYLLKNFLSSPPK